MSTSSTTLLKDANVAAQPLLELAYRQGSIGWLDWLAVARIASEDSTLLTRAFGILSIEMQFSLVERMRSPESGPLALAVLLSLASCSSDIVDEQVRQFVLEDAIDAWIKTNNLVVAIRKNIEPLAARLEDMRVRFTESFDLVREHLRLEREIAELRLQEATQDEKYDAIHRMEQEIIRLQTRRRIIVAYDADARCRVLDELKKEVDALDARKRSLEVSIGELASIRDKAANTAKDIETELEQAKSEADELNRRIAHRQLSVQQRRAANAVAKQEATLLAAELQQLEAEAARIEAARKLSAARIQSEKKRLEDIGAAASQSELTEIEAKVREVYAMLPADKTAALL